MPDRLKACNIVRFQSTGTCEEQETLAMYVLCLYAYSQTHMAQTKNARSESRDSDKMVKGL
jgi:hypothetical protein